MSVRSLSVRALLFFWICQVRHEGLSLGAELNQKEPPKKIAIIGGGIGGTAAAYFLRQEFGPSVKIDVYEAGTVGGRLATENIRGQEYETGGSVIHPLNLHMKHFVDRLGLSARPTVPSKMAIFDGKELTFQTSDWLIINFLRMLWHFGLNSFRMRMWIEDILDKFMRIYQYQQFGYSFSSVERLLHAMGGDGYLTLLNQTLEEAMLAHGFSQAYINDFVTPISRINFGQKTDFAAFVGVVSLACTDSGLWAVDGGNKRVCSGLLDHSNAELIQARVTDISVKTRPSKSSSVENVYELNYIGDSGPAHSLYDIVIVATPLHQGLSDISFTGFSPPVPSHFPGHFIQLFTTLVLGRLNMSYLGTNQKAADFDVSQILTLDNEALPMLSLSSLDPIHIPPGYRRPPASESKVWRTFSLKPLSKEHLQEMFESYEDVVEKRWLSYPSYTPPPSSMPSFVLHDHLYYLNAIELAASCMEMSTIAARNVALLAHHRWHDQTAKIDQEDLHTRLRGEL